MSCPKTARFSDIIKRRVEVEGKTTRRVVVLGDEHPKESSNQDDSYGPIHLEDILILRSARAG